MLFNPFIFRVSNKKKNEKSKKRSFCILTATLTFKNLVCSKTLSFPRQKLSFSDKMQEQNKNTKVYLHNNLRSVHVRFFMQMSTCANICCGFCYLGTGIELTGIVKRFFGLFQMKSLLVFLSVSLQHGEFNRLQHRMNIEAFIFKSKLTLNCFFLFFIHVFFMYS